MCAQPTEFRTPGLAAAAQRGLPQTAAAALVARQPRSSAAGVARRLLLHQPQASAVVSQVASGPDAHREKGSLAPPAAGEASDSKHRSPWNSLPTFAVRLPIAHAETSLEVLVYAVD